MAQPFGKLTRTARRSASSSSTTFRTSNATTTTTTTPEVLSAHHQQQHQQPPVRYVTTPATAPITTPEDASWSSCSTHDDSISEASPRRTLFPPHQPSSPQLRSRKSIESSDDDGEDVWFRQYSSSKDKPSRMPLTALVPWLLALVSLTSVSMIFVMNHNVASTAQHDVFILHTQPRSTLRRPPPTTNLHQLALKQINEHHHQHHSKPKQHAPKQTERAHTRHRTIQHPTGSIAASPWPLDSSLYKTTTTTNDGTEQYPRVVRLHKSSSKASSQKVKLYKSPYTDETQLYDQLDSSDTPTMERPSSKHDDDCQPMADWQTTVYPSCNSMHEIQLEQLTLFGMKGFWRNAWRYDQAEETVVLKTLRINHRFEEAYYENNRIDAVVLERLTASPHVINVFGFCGNSVLTEFADGKRLGELADKKRKEYGERLRIARDIASGLRDVHTIDYKDNNATFVHMDINPANVVSIGGTLKLNDFNIGVPRLWNKSSNRACGIPTQYPNPQWRSPEEAAGSNALTEKIDVFSLGHILFRLICGHEPWHKLEPGGVLPPKDVLSERVKRGILPTIPDKVKKSKDPEIVAIRSAMMRCYTFDPEQRPSARDIADSLQAALDHLPKQKSSTKS